MRLKNKVAIITGASRGIGKATALLFAEHGCKVVVDYFVSDLEPDAEANAHRVVNEIKQMNSQALPVACDVRDEKQVQKMFETAVKTYKGIDILVNNAGVVLDRPLEKRQLTDWKRTMDTNLLGTFLCSRYAGQHMSQGGRIINLSSTNATNCFSPDSIDYDASKAGIITLTKDFAKALAPKINVNAVAPGWVDTDMNKGLPTDVLQKQTDDIFLKRFARPEEIAATILFLASDDASYVNGSVLVVDGGHN